MLYGYIIFVVLPKKCTIPIISFLTKISIHFGSSGSVGGFRRLRLSSCVPAPRSRSCRIVSVGNGFRQPLGIVAVACGVTGGIRDADEVAAFVVGIAHQFLAVEGDGGHLKVMIQTTLWFGFVLTQPTYWVCFNIFPRINLNRFVEYIP